MILVIDTNVLLVSLPKLAICRPIFDAYLNGQFKLAISNEVITEYIEIIGQRTTSTVASNLAELITIKPNTLKSEIYFRWNLISVDLDDNKFTDLYVASNADYLVTNDVHFDEVKKIDFPKISVISSNELLSLLQKE